jgi:hypothetical protein
MSMSPGHGQERDVVRVNIIVGSKISWTEESILNLTYNYYYYWGYR